MNNTHNNKIPNEAKLLIDNKIYKIDKIHFDTKQVTLKESEKVYNTVLIKYIEFVFDEFSDEERICFEKKLQ